MVSIKDARQRLARSFISPEVLPNSLAISQHIYLFHNLHRILHFSDVSLWENITKAASRTNDFSLIITEQIHSYHSTSFLMSCLYSNTECNYFAYSLFFSIKYNKCYVVIRHSGQSTIVSNKISTTTKIILWPLKKNLNWQHFELSCEINKSYSTTYRT